MVQPIQSQWDGPGWDRWYTTSLNLRRRTIDDPRHKREVKEEEEELPRKRSTGAATTRAAEYRDRRFGGGTCTWEEVKPDAYRRFGVDRTRQDRTDRRPAHPGSQTPKIKMESPWWKLARMLKLRTCVLALFRWESMQLMSFLYF